MKKLHFRGRILMLSGNEGEELEIDVNDDGSERLARLVALYDS